MLDPVGADLSRRLLGQEDIVKAPGTHIEREGVLFMTHDTITEPLPPVPEPSNSKGPAPLEFTSYDVFLAAVDKLRAGGNEYPEEVKDLARGPVRQPNHVHSVTSKDGWKFVRYFDPNGEKDDQYELYDLNTDLNERSNLLVYNADFPTVVQDETARDTVRIELKAKEMMTLLQKLEKEML